MTKDRVCLKHFLKLWNLALKQPQCSLLFPLQCLRNLADNGHFLILESDVNTKSKNLRENLDTYILTAFYYLKKSLVNSINY